ncbi:MAG: HAD family hydrolase [Sphaerochaeta sp.]|jgi:putative hydrolase of the HAD superfamily|nr:HAD family hydrolase [Sphaerochaeta sp.]MDX9914535.1 HAD family hydrolase [Sphaerochaeta sp.]
MAFLTEQGVRYLALDIDGTLYPKWMLNVRMVRSLFPSARLAFAFNWARKEYRLLQEGEQTIPANREGLLKRQAALTAARMGRTDTESVQQEIEVQFYQGWERSFRSIRPFDDLRGCLLLAKDQGLGIVALSDFPIAEKLETLGIADLVDSAYTSEQSGYLKPSGHAFALLLDDLECKAEEILYVGDSYTKDCVGAKKAGMYTALLTRKRARLYPSADLVVGSWKELAALIL